MSFESLASQSTVTVQRLASSIDAAGGVTNVWTNLYASVGMRIEDASANTQTQFARRQMNVTHEGFTVQRGVMVGHRVVEQVGTLATAVASGAKTTTFNGSAVDMGTDTSAAALFCSASQAVTAVSGTSPTLAGKIQESDDGVTSWGDVTGAFFSTARQPQTQSIRFVRTKRYLRYVGTVAGTNPSFTMSSQINPTRNYLVLYVVENRATGGLPFYADVFMEEQFSLS